jgi:hypothetical protein
MEVGTGLVGIIALAIGCRYACWPESVHDDWLALRTGSRSARAVDRKMMATIYRIVGAVFLLVGGYVVVRYVLFGR